MDQIMQILFYLILSIHLYKAIALATMLVHENRKGLTGGIRLPELIPIR